MVLYLSTYLHCFSCMWWLIVSKTQTWVSPLDVNYPTNYYRIYQKGIFQQYMASLHSTVLILLGSDVGPQDSFQSIIAAVGIFMGAIINANIFGELALIFSSLNKQHRAFQSKFAKINTAMINLKLKFDLQQEVRHQIMKNSPSLQSQNEMKEFLSIIAPSMKFRILMYQYKRILSDISMFKDRKTEIEFIL